MIEGAFLTVEPKIDGSCNYKGHEKEIEVIHFNHWIARHIDPDNPSNKSERQHGMVSIVKHVDKSSPIWSKKLCSGETIDKITIKFFKQPETGSEDAQHYLTYEFENCLIASVRVDIAGGTGEKFEWKEVIDFAYRQITSTVEDGNITFMDDVRH